MTEVRNKAQLHKIIHFFMVNHMKLLALRFGIVLALSINNSQNTLLARNYIHSYMPIVIGGDSTFDACPSTGKVIGLDQNRDGYLSVRNGPDKARFDEIDRIPNGQILWICDRVEQWFAVVYQPGDQQDCGVSTPWLIKSPYTGPCRSGWVHSRYVGDQAG